MSFMRDLWNDIRQAVGKAPKGPAVTDPIPPAGPITVDSGPQLPWIQEPDPNLVAHYAQDPGYQEFMEKVADYNRRSPQLPPPRTEPYVPKPIDDAANHREFM